MSHTPLTVADLPVGTAPAPVPIPHFPDALHTFVWRNWQLVPLERMGEVVGATAEQLREIGTAMGLSEPPEITEDQRHRSHLTVIKRNWHLIPYEQLLQLLGWTPDQMEFSLREDDFLFHKLGRLKPLTPPLVYSPPDEAARRRCAEIAAVVRGTFGTEAASIEEPLFRFVADLAAPPTPAEPPAPSQFWPRYCYSYFALYGDPLLDPHADPYPEGYLARLAQSGVSGVWLQAVLYKLTPFPWDPELSDRWEERLHNLAALVERARKHGISIYLYLNEPRSMPPAFFDAHPEVRGAPGRDEVAMCTSVPEVREYIANAITTICRAVPDVAGFFTITASENLTSCWSHHKGHECPRCAQRTAAEVIAEVNGTIMNGIRAAGSSATLFAWDWGWKDEDAPDTIALLPQDVRLMSVSEWSIPIVRGGTESVIGEYSISEVGPGPRARRHWALARARGLKVMAKIQAGCTWELSATPYIPALENVARHIANLREEGVDGLMLGWTLGGYPSPNLEVVAEMGRSTAEGTPPTPEEALLTVARRRFGAALGPAVVRAWQECSAAFREFPFHIGTVYVAPLQLGPANPLWAEPTGYKATMLGFAYDNLDAWRQVYPPEVFSSQLQRVADGFSDAHAALLLTAAEGTTDEAEHLAGELRVMETAGIHFRSVSNHTRFIVARDALATTTDGAERSRLAAELRGLLEDEIRLAHRLWEIQRTDSRIGFEATNQYYYVPIDLVEKVVSCRDLLEQWVPTL